VAHNEFQFSIIKTTVLHDTTKFGFAGVMFVLYLWILIGFINTDPWESKHKIIF